ncbi:MAG: GNAT family N-acetyltransferase [Balneola sp.]
MEKKFITFENLTPHQLYDLLKLRQDVFVIEQQCIYEDFDGYDDKSIHFLIYEENEIAAYSRIFAPNIKYKNESSIGRIIVAKQFRGGRLGKILIKESIDYCLNSFPDNTIRIEAQAALTGYYSKLGFTPDSDIYEVDGIDHLQMVYGVKNQAVE